MPIINSGGSEAKHFTFAFMLNVFCALNKCKTWLTPHSYFLSPSPSLFLPFLPFSFLLFFSFFPFPFFF